MDNDVVLDVVNDVFDGGGFCLLMLLMLLLMFLCVDVVDNVVVDVAVNVAVGDVYVVSFPKRSRESPGTCNCTSAF